MKDSVHHRKHVQRKILQSLRKENGKSQEAMVEYHRASVDFGNPATTFAYSKKKKAV